MACRRIHRAHCPRIAVVSFDDWLLALHVLSAFAFVAGLILFWVLIVAVRKTDTPDGTIRMEPIVKVGNAATGIGAGGTLVFGVWLAFSVGGYDIWDPWIIIALVLWAELAAAGQTGPSSDLLAVNRTQRGLWLHTAVSVVLLLIVVDMIWKPGA